MYLWFMSLSYADCPSKKEEFISKLHMQIANICAKKTAIHLTTEIILLEILLTY